MPLSRILPTLTIAALVLLVVGGWCWLQVHTIPQTYATFHRTLERQLDKPPQTGATEAGKPWRQWGDPAGMHGSLTVVSEPDRDEIIQAVVATVTDPAHPGLDLKTFSWWLSRHPGLGADQLIMVRDVAVALSTKPLDETALIEWLRAHVGQQGAQELFGSVMVVVERVQPMPQGRISTIFRIY